MRSPHRSIRALLGDRRGTSVIEFAFVAPILAFTTMSVADLAQALARKYALEQASYRALELLTAGSIQTDYTFLKPEAAAAAGEPEENVTIANWLECEGVKQTDFNGACASTQEVARFVTVTIRGVYVPQFGYGSLGSSFGADASGNINLVASSTMRVQ